ncbi:MFS transporter [Glutamicibacter creatinolyticus]|uniref:MFS transporter n=1 Tax=Glutamicibacter creatinolyticus TaxID=162496 RepID=A0A5B7WWZ2_9MICC|nr:MFS transporter [Glutamicibacter creatinolyticus]
MDRVRPSRAQASPQAVALTHRTTASLKLRKGAGRHYLVQTQLMEHQELALVEIRGSWAHVYVRGLYGWLPAAYLEQIPDVQVSTPSQSPAEPRAAAVPSRYALIEATHQTTATLNLRKGSGTGYPVIKVVDQGAKVKVMLQQGLWAQIQWGDSQGWVPSMYLQTLPQRPPRDGLISVPQQRALTTISLNGRRGPGDHYPLVRILQADTAVVVTARQGAWRKIERDGEQMWVPASQLRTVY